MAELTLRTGLAITDIGGTAGLEITLHPKNFI